MLDGVPVTIHRYPDEAKWRLVKPPVNAEEKADETQQRIMR